MKAEESNSSYLHDDELHHEGQYSDITGGQVKKEGGVGRAHTLRLLGTNHQPIMAQVICSEDHGLDAVGQSLILELDKQLALDLWAEAQSSTGRRILGGQALHGVKGVNLCSKTTGTQTVWNAAQTVTVWNAAQTVTVWNAAQTVTVWNAAQTVTVWNAAQTVTVWNAAQTVTVWNAAQTVTVWNAAQTVTVWNAAQTVTVWNAAQTVTVWNAAQTTVTVWNVAQTVTVWNAAQTVTVWNAAQTVTVWNAAQTVTVWNAAQTVTVWNVAQTVTVWNAAQTVTVWNAAQTVTVWNAAQTVTVLSSRVHYRLQYFNKVKVRWTAWVWRVHGQSEHTALELLQGTSLQGQAQGVGVQTRPRAEAGVGARAGATEDGGLEGAGAQRSQAGHHRHLPQAVSGSGQAEDRDAQGTFLWGEGHGEVECWGRPGRCSAAGPVVEGWGWPGRCSTAGPVVEGVEWDGGVVAVLGGAGGRGMGWICTGESSALAVEAMSRDGATPLQSPASLGDETQTREGGERRESPAVVGGHGLVERGGDGGGG
ncbi:unnamed protein product [Coregonus sp. 'balchen']|nr:unnamed protein product [Coregonus sp. 'balchen']